MQCFPRLSRVVVRTGTSVISWSREIRMLGDFKVSDVSKT